MKKYLSLLIISILLTGSLGFSINQTKVTGKIVTAREQFISEGTASINFLEAGAVTVDSLVAGNIATTGDLKVSGDAVIDGSLSATTGTFTGGISGTIVREAVTTIVSSATPTINSDNCAYVTITALATNITSMTTNLSGTPTNFQKLIFRIKDNGTSRSITWGSDFEAKGVALPTATTASKVLATGFIYDTVTSKWGCVASVEES